MSSLVNDGHSNNAPGHGVAIIGMACRFPGAPDINTFWNNIISGVDAIADVPPERWDPDIFYDPESTANDRVYCKRGGYLETRIPFDPLKYGIMPVAIEGGEPEQFLSLMMAHEALADAGYGDQMVGGERTEVILGRGNYSSRAIQNVFQHGRVTEDTLLTLKTLHPGYTQDELQEIKKELKAKLPNFSGENAPSIIPNLTTGRITNRLDLMGTNFTIDAACASALIATEIGVRDLLARHCDMALAGGIFICPDVGFVSVFCQANALSRRSQVRPFDKDADGTLIGEGVGFIVLKRTEDALRDGDRIYAVIKGVGTSSDGRALGPLAPRLEGEELALRRAYEMAGFSPQSIELIEAHGTGTPVGDATEVQALSRVWGKRERGVPSCALGTIKSMIGHTMPAAGIAALIKTALALYHRTLPPTLHCENPIAELANSPLYINTQTRPWVHGDKGTPRRAGVNAFGFGGVNAHVVLEEPPAANSVDPLSHTLPWVTEVCILQGESREALIRQVERIHNYLLTATKVSLTDLAYTLNTPLDLPCRLAIVASSEADLAQKLVYALQRLEDPQCHQIKDMRGIYFFEEPLSVRGKLAFLFPGEGSQYVNMLCDLCLHFPEVRAYFDLIDQVALSHGRSLVPSTDIFPPPLLSEDDRQEAEKRFWKPDRAVEGILGANAAMFDLLSRLEVRPDVIAGHSIGEWSAMGAAGVIDQESFLRSIPRFYDTDLDDAEDPNLPKVALVAVGADRALVSQIAEQIEGTIYVANDNCPHQVLIAGEEEAIEEALKHLRSQNVFCDWLPFNRGTHIPIATHTAERLRQYFSSLKISPPSKELYSYCTTQPYPEDPAEILEIAVQSWVRPVEFRKTIEAMYKAGVRIFVEVGARGILTAFVEDILRGRLHLAVASDSPRRSGITQLNHLVAMLAAQRIPMSLEYLYQHRTPHRLSLEPSTDADEHTQKPDAVVDLILGYPSMHLSRQPGSLDRVEIRAQSFSTLSDESRDQPPANSSRSSQDHGKIAAIELPSLSTLQNSPPNIFATDDPSTKSIGFGRIAYVMGEYLSTMEQFLDTQHHIMHSFLGRGEFENSLMPVKRPLGTSAPVTGASRIPQFPLIGTVSSFTPGQEVVALRQVDPCEDLFLEDHTFGSRASAHEHDLPGLPIVPMTVSMEIMAEVASLLMPGKILTAMSEIEAIRWIALDQGRTNLQITARRRNSPENEVEVHIQDLGPDGQPGSEEESPVIHGTMVFGDAYPERPFTEELSVTSAEPCLGTAEAFYENRHTFHGPRFQGVISLDESGIDGLVGHLRVLSAVNLFRSTPDPMLLTDFALLDAAGQLMGYWGLERLEYGYVVFPIRLERADIYGPKLPEGDRVRCQVRIRQIRDKYLQADMDLIGPDGQLVMRLTGWTDWRFYWSEKLWEFQRFPEKMIMAESWSTPISRFPTPEAFECFSQEPLFDSRELIWNMAWAYILLNFRERESFRSLGKVDERRNQWLTGRTAAKDAARVFLRKHHALKLSPADIEIAQNGDGRPELKGWWDKEIGDLPRLSLSHTQGLAVAIVGRCSGEQRLGVDLEKVQARDEVFELMAFTAEERALLDSLGQLVREEWVTRFWCAKEAVAKALGKGLVDGPQGITVVEIDPGTGTVGVMPRGALSQEFPEFAGVPLVTYTFRDGNYVVASTLCERG